MNRNFAAGLLLLSSASSSIAATSPDPRALFAAERVATGGDAWNAVRTVQQTGSLTVGDSPAPFTQVVDHRTGFNRRALDAGAIQDVAGFNGASWDAVGGLVFTIDLPGLQSDAITQAYMARDGWWSSKDAATMVWLRAEKKGASVADVVEVIPSGGNPVEVWIDRTTHLIGKTVLKADFGPSVTTYADWRTVGGVRLPFDQVTTDATGAVMAFKVSSASADSTTKAAAFDAPPARQNGSITRGSAAIVPFRFDGFTRGHIIVDGRVNSQPVTLIFDTGGANYFIPKSAQRLGLTTAGGMAIGGVGEGNVTGGYAAIRAISLGDAVLHDQSAIVAPLPYPATHPRSGIDVDGLVGAEFFWTFRTQIDYGKRTLRFSDPRSKVPASGTALPFFTDGHTAFVEATVDGVTGLFGIDTGDPGTVTVFRRFADAHRLFQGSGVKSITGGGVGGISTQAEFAARSFTIAGTKLPPPPVTVTDAKAGAYASKTLAGFLGAAILSRFTMTFDPAKHMLSLAPNRTQNAPYPKDRSGFTATQKEADSFEILSVKPGSAAAVAGLRSGDAIIAANGKSVPQGRLGVYDLLPLRYGSNSFTLTIRRDGHDRVIRIDPLAAE